MSVRPLLSFDFIALVLIAVLVRTPSASVAWAHSPSVDTARGVRTLAPVLEKVTPAERAGLKPDDAIVAIDGKTIRNAGDVRNRVGLKERGSSVRIGGG